MQLWQPCWNFFAKAQKLLNVSHCLQNYTFSTKENPSTSTPRRHSILKNMVSSFYKVSSTKLVSKKYTGASRASCLNTHWYLGTRVTIFRIAESAKMWHNLKTFFWKFKENCKLETRRKSQIPNDIGSQKTVPICIKKFKVFWLLQSPYLMFWKCKQNWTLVFL